MDTQNNNDNMKNLSDNNQEIDNPVKNENQAAVTPAAAEQPKSRKWFYIVISLLIVTGLAAGAWAYTNSNDETTISPSTNSTTTQPNDKNLKPYSVVYSFSTGIDDPTQVYTRPLSGGERVSAKTFKSKEFVAQSGVHKNKVFIATQGGFGSSQEVAIWYSEDSGKTFEKLFSEVPTNASETSMGAQITSASFSTDGTAIVFALLPDDRSENTVKEISLQTKIEKDLFSSDKAGVFIEAYNRDSKQIFYYTGCFNCDGNAYNKLYSRDLNENTESIIYETSAEYGVQTALNKDQTKALIVSGVSGESLGASPPYTIKELTITTKKFQTIATVDKKAVPRVGYSENGTPYYSDGNKLFNVGAPEPSLIFEDDQPINAVYLVDETMVVAGSGLNDFKITSYSLDTKKATIILNGDQNTRIFGVAWQ